MPKPTKGPRLGGSSSHQKALLANLATSLFEHGRIKTTEPKARALRPYAEKLITHAKKGTLHNRREVMKKIRDKDVVHILFAEIGPFYADRNGGYTRIVKVENRKGDNAPMAVIELVREKTVTSEADRARRSRSGGDIESGAAGASAINDYDNGIVSYGYHQATLASGALEAILSRYIDQGGQYAGELAPFMSKVRSKDEALRRDRKFKALLRKAGRPRVCGRDDQHCRG